MTVLSETQDTALSRYDALQIEQPHLFRKRLRRPLQLDRKVLEKYSREHQIVLGVAAATPQVLFVVDLVQGVSEDGEKFLYPYLRVISCGQLRGGTNVAIIATIEESSLGRLGDIVMIRQERHSLGVDAIEIPRGFGETDTSAVRQVVDELSHETGLTGTSINFLGATYSDSGLTDSKVSYYHVAVTSRAESKPEREEAIASVSTVSRDELWQKIRLGEVADGFTLQALALFERSLSKTLGA